MKSKNTSMIVIIGILLLGLLALVLYFQGSFQNSNGSDVAVQSFEDCVAAGNLVMESYPRKCRHGDVTFTEVINDVDEIVGVQCTESSECPLPMMFAIQSNCPYQSACIDGACAVVCPVLEQPPVVEESVSYQVSCSDSSECDCSAWDTENQYPCECVDGQCSAVVAQNGATTGN